ncbi:6-bladed beta-propeller [Neobacillus sp. OS1-33]|uniref:6-bladed beta-propeller n=1 Tax=Neobacillus sp. OS1-33 TaxID=3070683 RepID=UPI0027E125C5|nr:6-bladed beta-propeller [Neobacillus sp. OS1-33]WML24883.1 6-bladed beta-propeller [Neobacillus sp. OS1-33]
MKRRNVYIGMALIAIATAAVFTFLFLNNTKAVDTGLLKVITPNGAPNYSQALTGDFNKPLAKPMDVTANSSFTYVSDTNNKRVLAFDGGGNQLFAFGEDGTGKGQFKFPYGIATDDKGRVFVADLYNGNISIFNEKGKFIDYFAKKVMTDKKIAAPAALRIIDKKVYMTDIKTNKAYVFDLNGKLLLEVGKPGTKDGELNSPNGITVDDEGNIYIVDTANQRVEIFDKAGKFKKIINGSANGKGESIFVNPRGIGIDSRGIMYVVSNLTHLVYGFDKDGKKVFEFGGMGENNGQFSLPNGLFIDKNDNVYITDTLNIRVQIFK